MFIEKIVEIGSEPLMFQRVFDPPFGTRIGQSGFVGPLALGRGGSIQPDVLVLIRKYSGSDPVEMCSGSDPVLFVCR